MGPEPAPGAAVVDRGQPRRSTRPRALTTAEGIWRRRAVRLPVAACGFALVTLVTVLIAHPAMFGSFPHYDDEGYMLLALKSFIKHGSLYDKVFSQYGPFYYEAWGGLFSLFGVTVTHDSGRTATLVAWVASGLGMGLTVAYMTRSAVLGLATQMSVFSALWVMANEPMHPGGIICLLLTAIVAISCFLGRRPAVVATAALGGAVAALLLVKVNVGGFALLSLALVCTATYPALGGRRWLRPLVEVAFVALPFLLTSGNLGEGWARAYAAHVAVAAFCLVMVLRVRRPRQRSDEELWWLVGGFAAVAVACCATLLAAGTSLHGLVEGVIGQPLRQDGAFDIPLFQSWRIGVLDALALAGAVGYWGFARRREATPSRALTALASAVSIAVGVEMALTVVGKAIPADVSGLAAYQFSMLGFAWVGIAAGERRELDGVAFARLLLPALAVLQALHAYPVAGSQMQWATFLLIPVGALCVSNGVAGLRSALDDPAERRLGAAVGAFAAIVFLGFLVNVTLRDPLIIQRAAYDSGTPLDLPGATQLRLSPEDVALFRTVTRAVDRRCPAFLMLPGMDSFYFWTRQEPPTLYNATGWPTLFDEAHQRSVLAETRSIPGLCLLRNIPLAQGWAPNGEPHGPLVHFVETGFRPVASFGEYELLQRGRPGG